MNKRLQQLRMFVVFAAGLRGPEHSDRCVDPNRDLVLTPVENQASGAATAANLVKTAPEDAIEDMTVVDAVDRATGLPLTSRPERQSVRTVGNSGNMLRIWLA